ncbi:putative CoA-binding protein [Spongiibacter sp. IMCC21906]|uniref:CoA-binding protein n=1 Tax=Spongiibacter sp. IMCC21906 TaxID=1620392 RepID=UPI00062DD848|nr:CoA-binding protein [Spongiibacter sp. IMCC21906]AKH68953.1 putative CoA-binding protein [Spongiibacter sp. IMCC21906]
MSETVAVLGASPKPDRYSCKAVMLLDQYGHKVIPVNPYHQNVAGIDCVKTLQGLDGIDTVTLYLNPDLLESQLDELISLKPRRVIFNPGTESAEHQRRLEAAGITTEEACTLVLLRTHQF